MDAEGANDVVAADVIDNVPAIDADGTKDMVAAATNGANDGGSAVVATDTRWDDAVSLSSSAAFRTTRAPATRMPCMRTALSLSTLAQGSRHTLAVGFRTKEFWSNGML
jgi:hypothetical protein